MSGKGQMFFIAALVAILIMVTLRTSLNISGILENKKNLEIGLERQQFQNVRSELVMTVQLSYGTKLNISTNMNNFAKFLKDGLRSDAIDFSGVMVQSAYTNATASVDTRLNVTVLNILGSNMQTLNLSFNNVNQIFSLSDSSITDTNFTFNTASNTNYTLTMYWQTAAENRTEEITIPVVIGKGRLVAFFDIRMKSNRVEQRDKFTETFEI